MAKTTNVVVLDSSSLVALVRPDDHLHHHAVEIKQYLSDPTWRLLLPHEVFAETINAIGKRYGRRDAYETANALLEGHQTNDLVLIPSDPQLLAQAVELQRTATGGPSFIDCLVMVAARANGTRYIFGFDATFKKNGYVLPTDLTNVRAA